MREPRLTNDLLYCDDTDEPGWSARALRELARQLRVGNDFYYPLLGAARILETQKSK